MCTMLGLMIFFSPHFWTTSTWPRQLNNKCFNNKFKLLNHNLHLVHIFINLSATELEIYGSWSCTLVYFQVLFLFLIHWVWSSGQTVIISPFYISLNLTIVFGLGFSICEFGCRTLTATSVKAWNRIREWFGQMNWVP